MMDCRIDQDITVWLRPVRDDKGNIVVDDNGEEIWIHNNFESGWDEKRTKPALNSAFPDQAKAWAKGIWQKKKARLINSVIIY